LEIHFRKIYQDKEDRKHGRPFKLAFPPNNTNNKLKLEQITKLAEVFLKYGKICQ